MSGRGHGQGRARSRRRAAALGALILSALLTVVLLTRDETAVTDADLAVPGPSATEPAPDPGGVGPTVTVDGLPGARLGQRVTEDGPWWTSPLTDEDTACRFVQPQSDVGAPGLGTFAAVVDEQIVSVVVWQPADYLVPYVTTPHDVTMGEGLEAAALVPGAELVVERLPEPVIIDPEAGAQLEELRVVTVEQDGRETRYADLGGSRGIVYVEVRLPAAEACRPRDIYSLPTARADDAGVLSVDGWGPLQFGQPVAALVESGVLAADVETGTGACVRHEVSEHAAVPVGLRHVDSIDGRLVGAAVTAGRTAEGVAVGDPRSTFLQVYPGAQEVEPGPGTSEELFTPLQVSTADGLRLQADLVARGVVPTSVLWVFAAVEPAVGRLTGHTEDCDR